MESCRYKSVNHKRRDRFNAFIFQSEISVVLSGRTQNLNVHISLHTNSSYSFHIKSYFVFCLFKTACPTSPSTWTSFIRDTFLNAGQTKRNWNWANWLFFLLSHKTRKKIIIRNIFLNIQGVRFIRDNILFVFGKPLLRKWFEFQYAFLAKMLFFRSFGFVGPILLLGRRLSCFWAWSTNKLSQTERPKLAQWWARRKWD